MKAYCFVTFCLFTSSVHAASSSQSEQRLMPTWSIKYAPLASITQAFKTDLPSYTDAKKTLKNCARHPTGGNQFHERIRAIKRSECMQTYPHCVFFKSASTLKAAAVMKAIAAYTEIPYFYIQNTVTTANEHHDSKSFLIELLNRLALHPEDRFLILSEDSSFFSVEDRTYDAAFVCAREQTLHNVCFIAAHCLPQEAVGPEIIKQEDISPSAGMHSLIVPSVVSVGACLAIAALAFGQKK